MPETTHRAAVADLVESMSTRLDELVVGMGDMVVREIDFYRKAIVSRDELHDALARSLAFILTHLARPGSAAVDVSAPSATGRKRAIQGAPLPEVLRVYRLSFAYFWEELLAEAQRSGQDATQALLAAAGRIWSLADAYSTALTDSYREAVAERMTETDRRRSALVAALVDGPTTGSDTHWEMARALGFPFQGDFVVLMAEAATTAEPPLSGLDAKLRPLGVTSAWRAQPGHDIAVLALPRLRSTAPVLDAVRTCVTGRVGASPVYRQLDRTPHALRYAQVAMESLVPATPAVRQLEDTPLTELVMNNLDTTRRAVNRVLGSLLSLPEDERTTLLTTARAWLQAHGSASVSARTLHCHQNTVRYRMHRLEEHLREPLTDPRVIAELSLALDALGTFPSLLEPPVHP
ncbi:helix-turn-helix domain-containing protein [Streptomyces griseus]|uniref:PucR family transcriptional regulator n=1 Tax=Streptomyces griseus TaxID=1911 RepID=UPI003865D072|nr:helix-turn-helix domain-containing protein [Streptomyces fimicarius]